VAETDAKNPMGRDRDDDKAKRDVDAKDLRVRCQEYSQFEAQRHQDRPEPASTRGIADESDIHDSKGRAVAEVINPSEELGGGGINGLLDGFAQDHGAKAGEHFEKVHRRDDRGNSPFFREDKGKPEHIVGDGGQQAAGKANQNGAPKLARAALPIEERKDEQEKHCWKENEEGEKPHRTKVIEIKQETRDGRSGQKENDGAARRVPIRLQSRYAWLGHLLRNRGEERTWRAISGGVPVAHESIVRESLTGGNYEGECRGMGILRVMETPAPTSPGRNILVADDCDDDFFLLKAAFQKAGLNHRLQHVANGQLALAYLKGEVPYADRKLWPFPDLVVLDIKMPVMSGFEVLKELREQPDFKGPVIVMLSGSVVAEDASKAMELGAAHYFTKPMDFNELTKMARTIDSQWLNGSK
jgi:CheY-like chemotaxis protein